MHTRWTDSAVHDFTLPRILEPQVLSEIIEGSFEARIVQNQAHLVNQAVMRLYIYNFEVTITRGPVCEIADRALA